MLLLAGVPLAAQEPAAAPLPADTAGAPLHLGLEPIAPIFPLDLPQAPGLGVLWLRPRFQDWAAEWEKRTRSVLESQRTAAWLDQHLGAARPAIELQEDAVKPRRGAPAIADERDRVASRAPAAAAPGDSTLTKARPLLPAGLAEYADLGMKVTGRGELGGAWNRYHPCDPNLRLACDPSLFPQLKPDVQFGVLVAGTISDRLHVNVDYDQRREFDAANNINVYYQGFEDEVLQRVEVGDVSIRLPQSRYLTQGIPAGNFGFKATGQVGPMDFQAVWAQQKGDISKREFRLGGGAGGTQQGLVQDATVVLDDAAYAKGQFYFLVHPDSLRGAPDVDPLRLQALDAPASLRPKTGTDIAIYRDERISAANQQQQGQVGYFLARAVSDDGRTKHEGFFRRLTRNEDYVVHPSGLWITLRSPLRQDEALAIAYVSESGVRIGDPAAESAPAGTTPELRLIGGDAAIHQPGQPTWPYEMHQVYRVDSSNGVDVKTVRLDVSVGELSGGKTFTQANGKQLTYLKLLGLDEVSPAEQLDEERLYQPGTTGFATKVTGTYLFFPTLRPFAAPPPVPSENLSAADTKAALAGDANAAIYDNADPIARESAARFRLNFKYRVSVEGGIVSTLNLGALGIRDGSEKIYVGGQLLEPGKDYNIDYDIGAVTLVNPTALFGANPGAEVRATWEQKALFQKAPTSVFGLNSRFQLGKRGELNFIGLYQAERSLMTRPELGVEPGSIFLGGSSARLDLGGSFLDQVLSRVPGLRVNAPSAVNLVGEVALSAPNPNTRGDTYLDDFEATDEIPLSLGRTAWKLGARPDAPTGAEDVFPSVMDVSTAGKLVWQDVFDDGTGPQGLVPVDQIDRQIRTSGPQQGEPTLELLFGGGGETPTRRWRSLSTVLSTTGRDLSRSEYVEFYVAGNAQFAQDAALVLDLGSVSEDAYYFDAQGHTSGTYTDGKRWGLGELDEEASLARHEIWSSTLDANGLWDQACQAEQGKIYPEGDERANCTKGNGVVDSEDLDGNGVPALSDGPYFRYVVKLDGTSKYLVRDTTQTGTRFRLYRIPLRDLAKVDVGGAGEGTWRYIKQLRMTLVGVTDAQRKLYLTRFHLAGSRWSKREPGGVYTGSVGIDSTLDAQGAGFQVGAASRLTVGTRYSSPPGVFDQLQDPSRRFDLGGIEINEKALRLSATSLGPDRRAEVYYRYPQQPRNFLNYRQLRLWAVARSGSWGASGSDQLLVKLGSDPRNYYVYRDRLEQPVDSVSTGSWRQLTVDFEKWFQLRAVAEDSLVKLGARPAGAPPLAVWTADSAYAVVLDDRARAPNLAAVRELSFAIYHGGALPEPAEVWINDLRLGGAMTDPGVAASVALDIRAGDFLTANASFSSQGALFHQLNQDATYQRSGNALLNVTAQLGQILPATWNLEAPLTVSLGRTGLTPSFLQGTDVRADELIGLRETGGGNTRIGFSLRRRTPSSNPLASLLLDGTSLRLGYTSSHTGTITSLDESASLDGTLSYEKRPGARQFDIVPAFVESALRALVPARLEQSELFKRVAGAKLRWSPEAVTLSSSYYNQNARAYRYDRILALASDTGVVPVLSPRFGLTQDAHISFHPFESLVADIGWNSTRDLLPPDRATQQALERQAIERARSGLGGLDLGWETNRGVTTSLTFRPTIASWLRPGFTYTAHFRGDRSPSYLALTAIGDADTLAVMQRQFQQERQVSRTLQFDPAGFITAVVGKKPGRIGGTRLQRVAHGIFDPFRPIELTWDGGLNSQFQRAGSAPGSSYQLGLGGLDAFRLIGADTAINAGVRDAFRARSGLRLPFGTELTTSYDRSRSDALDLRGGRGEQLQRTWPNVQLSWMAVPIPKALSGVFTRASLSGGIQRTLRSDVFGSLAVEGEPAAFARRGRTDETSMPFQASLGIGASMTASYNVTLTSGTVADPTGDAQKDGSNHAVSVSGFFHMPSALKASIPNPVQATLSLSQQGDRQCRVQSSVSLGACVPFVDYITRRLNLTLDTEINDLSVGLQMSYNARQSNIGTLNGNSQFQLSLFGQFNFSAGQVPGAAPAGIQPR